MRHRFRFLRFSRGWLRRRWDSLLACGRNDVQVGRVEICSRQSLDFQQPRRGDDWYDGVPGDGDDPIGVDEVHEGLDILISNPLGQNDDGAMGDGIAAEETLEKWGARREDHLDRRKRGNICDIFSKVRY